MGAGTLSREGGGGGWEKDDSEVIEEEARAEGLQWTKRALGIGNSSMCRGVREEEGDGGTDMMEDAFTRAAGLLRTVSLALLPVWSAFLGWSIADRRNSWLV
ncbi:hypothetical protein U1Q18_037373 [Sarracenia purpurea var. burkii]